MASMAFTPILSGFAQISELKSPEALSEVQAYIRQCRRVIPVNGSVEVYDNTDLETKKANRIGTINVGTDMMLTGVVREAKGNRPTAVQIYMRDRRFPKQQPVGWVDASKITKPMRCP
ncbi:hypothetical protein [Phormidium tenue]|nr:hypothetical protein [Phormidium tenue]MBD2233174.1 hypothetical protein [Phormidium tenue FACHB-1052]